MVVHSLIVEFSSRRIKLLFRIAHGHGRSEPTLQFLTNVGDSNRKRSSIDLPQKLTGWADYARASAMLQPATYPDHLPPLRKTIHLQKLSDFLGSSDSSQFYRAPITTFFHNGRNGTGVSMRANALTGNECTGLNDGSKNSVAVTYLADAWNWGAEIFCGCEVRFVRPCSGGDGYDIFFSLHGSGREAFPDDFEEQLFWVKAVRM